MPFTFTVGGATLVVRAGFCALGGVRPIGTQVTIQERVPAGYRVTGIAVDPANRAVGSPDVAAGKVTVAIGAGFTTATFTDAVAPTNTPTATPTNTPTRTPTT